jgi:hypothetical protein
MKKKTAFSLFIAWMIVFIGITSAQERPARVTILYDAFGKPSTLKSNMAAGECCSTPEGIPTILRTM